MGLYLRKSIKVGPLRFNLSKSGVGVSTGIKGFRVGTGHRGNYIHMGAGGIYYRATITSSNSANNGRNIPTPPAPSQPRPLFENPTIPSGTVGPMEEIESADATQIVDSSSRELLDEMNKKRTKVRLWPFVAAITGLIWLFATGSWPAWVATLWLLFSIGASYAAYTRDELAKTTVLFYDFDSKTEQAYENLLQAADNLSSCSSIWHIEASGKVHDRKYHAGASNLLRRSKTFIKKSAPPYVKTNVETAAVSVGKQTLYFFPDRVLIFDANGIGAVSYSDLNVEARPTQFIESESVPSDAKVVGHTWQYVNKSGGPDKRFKDNKQLPVCQYEEITLFSDLGLEEKLQFSNFGLAAEFINTINSLS